MTTDLPQEPGQGALAQNARESLARCGNCAQASFAALQDEFHLDAATVLKALTPFPGIALRGETCGAVVGSLMALGLVFGREDLEDWGGYTASLPPARRFCRRFEKQNGSTACAGILEAKLGRRFNLADADESAAYLTAGGDQVCADVVASAVEIAGELIRKQREGPSAQEGAA